jgi:hypothetical protein
LQREKHPPAYAAMEPRQYRPKGGMSASEGRNGGDAKKLTVELAKPQNGRANKSTVQKKKKLNLQQLKQVLAQEFFGLFVPVKVFGAL